jgi:dipeptidyl aminopeptidase/acylaminoacyl peptidase
MRHAWNRVTSFALAALPLLTVAACCCPCTPRRVCGTPAQPTAARTVEIARPPVEVPLIPREVLFGNPDRAGVRLSPDGTKLSWLAPVDGVMNLWVAPRTDPKQGRAVSKETGRGVGGYQWAYDNRHVLYTKDNGGDENWRVVAIDVETLDARDLTPTTGVQARIEELSPDRPGEVLVGLNERDKRLHDLYVVEIATGKKTLQLENAGYSGFLTDGSFKVHGAAKVRPDGGVSYLKHTADGKFESWLEVDHEDASTTSPLGFTRDAATLYMRDSRGRDTAALFALDVATGKADLLAEDAKADVASMLGDPATGRVQAAGFTYDRLRWKVLDKGIQGDLDALAKVDPGELTITARTERDDLWVVAFLNDDGPVRYFLYERPAKKATYLFTNRSDLEGLPLVPMHPVVIQSRDGLPLVSYLSLPKAADPQGTGRPNKPVPLVLEVHGGPWARDGWGYNPSHQWLANRGYAVLSVNFRGSTGFGKRFLVAANLEWARKMHDDLLDAVDWAVKQGIADKSKVAISGGSYGGYATLVGLTVTPEVFACGVDVVGPSSLLTLLKSVPPYWKPQIDMMRKRVGDLETEEGRALLLDRSPLTHVAKIQRPLLIGQGANDQRVKQAEADQIVKAMEEKKIPVTYALYPDEGHGFARPPNRISFYAVQEAFLAPILGGRAEPIGDALKGSTLQVPAGREHVPGLAEALKAAGK